MLLKKPVKKKKQPSKNKKWYPKIIRFFLISIAAIFLFIFLFISSIYVGFFGKTPTLNEIKQVEQSWSSEIFSKEEKLLGKYYIKDRVSVDIKHISPNVLNALISTEDARFFEHSGIDFRGLARVFIKTLLLGDRSSGGGSTISQQLAKNLFPRKNYVFMSMAINKTKEAIVATRIEKNYTKEEVLNFYLNTVSFGENVFGIEAASQRYFNTSALDLKIEEAAVLVGILKANTTYNPRLHPENALGRRNVVLAQMQKYGYLDKVKADSLMKLPITLDYHVYSQHDGSATYFRDHVKNELLRWCNTHKKENGEPYNLYTDGLKIYTTIDAQLQHYAEKAVSAHMKKLQRDFDNHWKGEKPWKKVHNFEKRIIEKSVPYQKLKEKGLSEKEIYEELFKKKKMTVFSWQNAELDTTISTIDSLFYYERFLHAGFLVVEPNTGNILAWVGGINHKTFQYNYVNARRQAGSTFKPIVYSAALKKGISPCAYISNRAITFTDNENWTPENSDDEIGGKYSLKGALTHSLNIVSARVIKKTGVPKVIELSKEFGITTELPPVPSIALGTADISLYEMVNAYNTFPSGGYYTTPSFITRIEDRYGNVLENFSSEPVQKMVLTTDENDMIRKMMESVVNEGTAVRLRSKYHFKDAIAGKTGTTQNNSDGWFIGYTPYFTAGAWVGANYRAIHFKTTRLGQGANTALPIWALFFEMVKSDASYNEWTSKKFPTPSQKVLNELDCELYKQTFWDLFRKKSKSKRTQTSGGFFNSLKKKASKRKRRKRNK